MNKKKILPVAVLLFCMCLIAIVIIKSNAVHQAENVYAREQPMVCDKNGMYYFNSAQYLMFMDYATGTIIPVCAKANCTHNSPECNACYYGGHGFNILLYDDKLFISYFTIEYVTDDEGNETNCGSAYIECSDKDGSGRKQIYKSDSGTAASMLAADGKLYYTAYKSSERDETSIDYFVMDEFLYCYDMDWGTTKKLQEYKGDYEHYNAGLYLIKSTDKNHLYLRYSYETEPGNDGQADYNHLTELITLDTKGNLLDRQTQNANIDIEDMYIDNGTAYVAYIEDARDYSKGLDPESLYYVWKSDGTKESQPNLVKKMLSKLDGYFYDIIDERKKLLLDCESDTYYISKSAVSDSPIVPDIWLIDRKNDVVYYDTTDYTGIAPGTLFTEDPSVPGCMKWSDFMEEFFVKYEGQQVDGISIDKGDHDGN